MEQKPRSNGAAILGISIGLIVLVGAIYGYRRFHKQEPAQVAVTPVSQNSPASTSDAPPATPSNADSIAAQPPSEDAAKPADTLPSAAPTASAAKKSSKNKLPNPPNTARDTASAAAIVAQPAVPPPATPVTAPTPAPPAHVDFDPKSLNANENSRLRIEADRFPPNVGFTIELNGKIFFERGAAKTQTTFDDLFIPPGVHELRVVAGSGANRKSSNIVSAEFKAKKKKTLRLELRTQGKSSDAGVPQDVYPDSQIFLALK